MKIQLQEVSDPRQRIWVSSEVPVQVNWFETNALQNSDQLHMGRAAVKKIIKNGLPMILRHYYRGGVPARFSKDRFVFFGWQSTRACRELFLLQEMLVIGLPVPQPIAARSILHGVFYSSDILMLEIENTHTLAQLLIKERLTPSLWREVGRTIKKFHMQGYEHVDLNANNILIDQKEKVYLIDFDRCKQRKYAKKWAQNGIDRLRRSLQKLGNKETQFHFERAYFASLLQGYEE